MPSLPPRWTAFYRIVRRIPRGRVATYGDVALAAGVPRGARQVGFALSALRGSRHDIPWQRVLGARPRGTAGVSILDPVGAAVQRALLEREGVRFDERGFVDLARFGWGRRAARGRRRGGSQRGSSHAGSRPTGRPGAARRGREVARE